MSDTKPQPPAEYELVYEGDPLPPFYAAEMIRRYTGKTIWACDAGWRVRCGMVTEVPWLREDAGPDSPPVQFEDEKPLYLREIVHIAVYAPPW